MKENLIYNDEGVCQTFIPYLEETFQKTGSVKYTTAQEIIKTDWFETTSCLVIPGGRDRPYHQLLKGKGNHRIRAFIEQGGIYIGICAGAYYACSHIEFAKGTPSQIIEPRELKFFPGVGMGPFLGYEKKFISIFYQGNIFERGLMYYHEGPTFVGSTDCLVIATYEDQNFPAIIMSNYGKGKVILSGVHFEHPNIEKKNELIRQKIISDLFELLSDRT